MPYRCDKCGREWDDRLAVENDLQCTRKCGGTLVQLADAAGAAASAPNLENWDLAHLPYPVALTAGRLQAAMESSADILKTLFALKDCFEATIKYLGVVLLAEYFRSPACTPERNAALLEKMVRPSLGVWVDQVVGDLSHWLVADESSVRVSVARVFAQPARQQGGKAQAMPVLDRCKQFVSYRNDALGHGAMRSDRVYAADLTGWLPLIGQLLDAVAELSESRLCLVTDVDRCRSWMGPAPAEADEPGHFRREHVGHFVLRAPDAHVVRGSPTPHVSPIEGLPGDSCRTDDLPLPAAGESRGDGVRDLYPFLCYLPDAQQQQRLHFYDSIYRYKETRKEVQVLEYDEGFKHNDSEPVAGLEEAFTAELLSAAFKRHQGRMEVIEGRVANFGELIVEHAEIVGRRFAIDHVTQFIAERDRGLLVIEAEPGKGKTALMAHLIENVFGHYSPPPVHFFYRRTAGITDPDVCLRSLYHSLLEAHNITEAEESRQRNSPEEVFTKLVNLLAREIAPRLSPQRAQLIFVDALDEADSPGRPTVFQRLPENLPAGVYIIATTRPVTDRASLARRAHVQWYDLDAPDLLQLNLADGVEYVQGELAASDLPGATLDEIARVGRGNFLVLKLLCGHVRTRLEPAEVGEFLRGLASGTAKDQLGFIYEEFWNRLASRLSREDGILLCDVAGLLVTARAPLSAEVVCTCLKLRAGDWDFALRHLAEYLTVVQQAEEGEREAYYRIYHESFADFLRSKLSTDRQRYESLLADYCLEWSSLPVGRGRLYALRFAPDHLRATSRWDELETLLTDIFFLEAKTTAGLVFDLAGDFSRAVAVLPEARLRRWILTLLEEALRRDIHFIARHAQDYPQGLFQCLWNSCWWYDCPAAAQHYTTPPARLTATERGARGAALGAGFEAPPCPATEGLACQDDGSSAHSLHVLLERWRQEKDLAEPKFAWLRSHRPPLVHLGTAQKAVLRGHTSGVTSVSYSPDGARIASGSKDKTVRVWDAASGECLEVIRGSGDVAAIAAGAARFPWRALARDQETIVEDAATGDVVAQFSESVSKIVTHPSGQSWAGHVGESYLCIITLEGAAGLPAIVLRHHELLEPQPA